MRNARQILDIVLAAFGQGLLESDVNADAPAESKTDYQELARGWQDLASGYDKGADGEGYSELIPSIMKAGYRRIASSMAVLTNR